MSYTGIGRSFCSMVLYDYGSSIKTSNADQKCFVEVAFINSRWTLPHRPSLEKCTSLLNRLLIFLTYQINAGSQIIKWIMNMSLLMKNFALNHSYPFLISVAFALIKCEIFAQLCYIIVLCCSELFKVLIIKSMCCTWYYLK